MAEAQAAIPFAHPIQIGAEYHISESEEPLRQEINIENENEKKES
jgi:hypothetical protein